MWQDSVGGFSLQRTIGTRRSIPTCDHCPHAPAARAGDEDGEREPGERIAQMVVGEVDDCQSADGRAGAVGARFGIDKKGRDEMEPPRCGDLGDVAREPGCGGGSLCQSRCPGSLMRRRPTTSARPRGGAMASRASSATKPRLISTTSPASVRSGARHQYPAPRAVAHGRTCPARRDRSRSRERGDIRRRRR